MGRDGIDRTAAVFYRTWRAGACRLSDGGGPFGFDIAVALLADELIAGCRCEAIAETGCFLGDTTAYLARRYPHLPVYACDIDPAFCAFTARRLAQCANVTVTCEDSPAMLARAGARHARTFAFLDAHWGARWPLPAELDTLSGSVAVVHDFDIGHPRFSFDTYQDTVCGPELLARMARPPGRYFVLDPAAGLPLPCLQTGRRAGVAVITAGLDDHPAQASRYLTARSLPQARATAAP
jgi:SAM-dependent methyltransferase